MPYQQADESASKPVRVPRSTRSRVRTPRAEDVAPSPYLSMDEVPALRNPLFIMAFEGWNDAGESATTAARVIVTQRDGYKFASIDPEEFFVFTETRPHVKVTRRGRRRIEWPANEFFACIDPRDDSEARDLVVMIGTEPDLRWRQFTNIVLDVARRTRADLVVGLGALHADIPHTLPPRVTGSTGNQMSHPLLDRLTYKPSKYRGPTGIVGVLTNRFSDVGLPTLTLWGHAPHYISASPNPVVAARILRELGDVLQLSLDMEALDDAARRFDEQVREAVSSDPEAMAYVRDLETRYKEERDSGEDDDDSEALTSTTPSELPSGAAMVDALEEFLRKRRRFPGSGPGNV